MKRVATPCLARSGSSRSIVSMKISMSASTSSGGRDQFSVENAKTQTDSTPRSIAASTVRRSAFVPDRCPAATGSLRRLAQRPFPSMMIAIERATSGRLSSGLAFAVPSVRSLVMRFMLFSEAAPQGDGSDLNLHDLGLFALQKILDLRDVLVGQLLDAVLGAPLLVVPDVAVLDELLEVVHDVAAQGSDREPALPGEVLDDLHELLAPFLRQLRDRQTDDLAVVRRRETEIGLEDRALDRLDRSRVVRLHGDHARLGDVDRRELLERRRRPVVVDLDAVEERRGRAAGPDCVELVRSGLDRLVHPSGRVAHEVVDHSSLLAVEIIVPIRSPRTTRPMLRSSSRPKTWIGRLLSMQSESAVESITLSPRSSASRCVSSGRKVASGFSSGSPS